MTRVQSTTHLDNKYKMKIMHQNVQSLNSNSLTLAYYIGERNFDIDIIALTETWQTNINTYRNLLQDYKFFSKQSNSKSGGIVLYIKPSIIWKEIKQKKLSDIYDLSIISINCKLERYKEILLMIIYRHVNTNENDFRNELCEEIEALQSKYKNKPIIIMGDINIDITKKTYKNMKYLNDIESKGFKQIIQNPTRITEKSSTLIDHVFLENKIKTYWEIENSYNGISDHNMQLLKLRIEEKMVKEKIMRRIYLKDKENDYIQYMINRLQELLLDFQLHENNIEIKFTKLQKIIKEGIDQYFPIRLIKQQNTRIKWFNPELRKLRKDKDRKYKQWKKSKSYIDKLMFQKTQLEFKNKIKIYEQDYYKNKIIGSTIKNKWKIINELLGKNKQTDKIIITNEKGIELTTEETVNKFNDFFIQSGNVCDTVCNKGTMKQNGFINTNTFFYTNVTSNEVEKVIISLNETKATSDDYGIIYIKKIAKQVAPLLTILINETMEQGNIPKLLKISVVKPVYKSGDSTKVENYRPISLTPVFHKIMEKLILEQMWKFVIKYNLINDNQYGFRKGHSTVHAILSFINNIYAKIKTDYFVGIFLDLKKAYDSISHEVLLNKLGNYGFRGKIGIWLKDYLKNRVQIVKMGNIKSKELEIQRGILQGSILGCLLFCLYINDIVNITNIDTNITLFADDTNVLIHGNTINEAMETANKVTKNIDYWLAENSMALNANKTKHMIFQKCKNQDIVDYKVIKYKENIIEEVKDINFLGIVIDNKLNFKNHINKIVQKIKKLTYCCYKIRDKLDDKGKQMFYYSMIHSVILYGIEVYSNTTWENLKILDNIHKKIIKTLFCIPKKTATKEVYIQSKLLDLRHIIMLQMIKIGYQWANNKLPNKIQTLFQRQGLKNTRQKDCIYKKSFKTNQQQKVIDFRVSRYWNVLPKDIKTKSDKDFKKCMKLYYFQQMKTMIKGESLDKYY